MRSMGLSSLPICAQSHRADLRGIASFAVIQILVMRFGLIRSRCQTVPSPFGSGSSVAEVASCVLHSLLVHNGRRSEEHGRGAQHGNNAQLNARRAH